MLSRIERGAEEANHRHRWPLRGPRCERPRQAAAPPSNPMNSRRLMVLPLEGRA